MASGHKISSELMRCDVLGHRWVPQTEQETTATETCARCGAVEVRFDLTDLVGIAG